MTFNYKIIIFTFKEKFLLSYFNSLIIYLNNIPYLHLKALY